MEETRQDTTRAASDMHQRESLQKGPGPANATNANAQADAPEIGTSAAIISICTIISRITGFIRTWSMAFALGATFLSSSYQVANNLPNMLYELVMGGMLTTAFLPVYVSLRKKSVRASEEYASNLLTLVVLALGALALICMLFPAQIVYTQSFYSDQSTMSTATLLFQFFAIQVVFYGASSILSGILNSNRDYIWGAIAPVFNNLIVIAAFIAYAVIAPASPTVALYVIAIGSPLGVFVQMAVQMPGLRRCGIRLRPRLDLKDPALRETAAIGLPALFITVCGFVTVSVANAASYSFADNGPSVIAYARLWFTFPYSFLAIPIATTLFTELSSMTAEGDHEGVAKGMISGSSQIFFLMVPFAMYLMAFAQPLVTLYHIGAFSEDAIAQIASYLAVMACALPFYGVNTFLQMAFSSIRRMVAFSLITLAGSASQVALMLIATSAKAAGLPTSIEWIAAATISAYLVGDIIAFAYLRREYAKHGMRLTPILKAIARGAVLGAAGAIAGWLVYQLLCYAIAPVSGSAPVALAYTIASGCVSIAVTFAPAIAKGYPEAAFMTNLFNKASRLFRSKRS